MKVGVKTFFGGLCGSCRYLQETRFTDEKPRFRCGENGMKLEAPAVFCSMFSDKTSMTPHEMRSVGWILRVNKKGGFDVLRPGEEAWDEEHYQTSFSGAVAK
jgi:hypothetical protein